MTVRPRLGKGGVVEGVICEVMAGWARRGYYELDALLAHVETCEICAVAMATAAMDLQDDDDGDDDDGDDDDGRPSAAQLAAWADEGGCEATDGCWVEPDGHCEHGRPSWLLVLGYV